MQANSEGRGDVPADAGHAGTARWTSSVWKCQQSDYACHIATAQAESLAAVVLNHNWLQDAFAYDD